MDAIALPDGLVAIVKRDCPTCALVAPVLARLAGAGLTVYSRDDPGFPPGLDARDDTSLELPYRLGLTTVPTLLRVDGGREVERTEGWLRVVRVVQCARRDRRRAARRPGRARRHHGVRRGRSGAGARPGCGAGGRLRATPDPGSHRRRAAGAAAATAAELMATLVAAPR